MIFVECKPDFELVKSLGIGKKLIAHAGNKASICKRLQKIKNSKGMVDEDPYSIQPSYIKNLEEVSNENDIKLLFDRRRNNYIIVLSPRLEEWVLKVAEKNGIDPRGYHLPNDADYLHKQINQSLQNFKKLLQALHRSKEFQYLKKVIKI